MMDKFYLEVISSDEAAFAILVHWIGLANVVVLMLIMRIPLQKKHLIGSHIDPNYSGFILPRGKFLLYLILAGICAAFSSVSYFYLVGSVSPATVMPFGRLVIVYLIIAESLSERNSPTVIELQSITMIIIGIFIMTLTEVGFDPLTLLIVLGPYNLSIMFFTIALRKAKRMVYQNRKNDALNVRLWSLTFNAIFLSLLIIPFITPATFAAIGSLDASKVVYISIDMLITTFAFIAYIRALGIAKMSIVNAILSLTVVLGIPFSIIGNIFYPGAFGVTEFSATIWIFKLMGALIIIVGIITIGLSQVKAYILIYLEKSPEIVMQKLGSIKGIMNISAVSNKLMLIATLRIRSLGMAYRSIVTELEKIEGIRKVVTLTTIKDWEKV